MRKIDNQFERIKERNRLLEGFTNMINTLAGEVMENIKLQKLREIEDSLLEETKNLVHENDSELDFEEIDFDTYSLNGTYTAPVDGTYLVIEKYGEYTKTLKKGDKIELKDANSISKIK